MKFDGLVSENMWTFYLKMADSNAISSITLLILKLAKFFGNYTTSKMNDLENLNVVLL